LLLARAAPVLCLGDVFAYGEEFEKAAVGRVLLADMGVSWRELPYHPYEGGGFVQSLLDAVAFVLLGPSTLALKATTLVWNLAILWAGFALMDRNFGRSSARIFGLLLIAAPASFQKISLLALGIHFEATLFLLLLLGRGLDLARTSRAAAFSWGILGSIGGFACYFSYQSVLVVASVGAGLVFARAWPTPRALAALISGFLAGLTPWLLMWARWGPALFDVHGTDRGASGDGLRAVGSIVAAVFEGRGPLDAAAQLLGLAALPWLALRLGWGPRLSDESRRASAWILGFATLFGAAYLLSGFAVEALHHYVWLARLAPLWMAASLALSAVLGDCIQTGGGLRRRLGLLAAAVWIVSGLAATVRECALGSPGPLARNLGLLASQRGYDWGGYLQKLWPRLPLPEQEKLERFRSLRDGDGVLLEEALASVWAQTGGHDLGQIEQAAGTRAGAFVRGLGPWLQQQGGRSLKARLARARQAPANLRPWLLEAVGRFGLGALRSVELLEQESELGLSLGAEPEFFVGLGWRAFQATGSRAGTGWRAERRRLRFAPELIERFLAARPERERALIASGIEAARAAHALP
jgi:hypothetical protein